ANAPTTQGGTVTLAANGHFVYNPPVGITGVTDTFTYTLKNSANNTLMGTGTVKINLTNMVWYVDNSYAGANGASDGRSHRPFTSITAANLNGAGGAGDVDGAGDIIFLHTGTGAAYTGGIALEASQTLHGQGDVLTGNGFPLV